MKIKDLECVKSKKEARDFAIKWQEWQSKQCFSWAQQIKWAGTFAYIGRKFKLSKEFQENGII